MRLDFNLFAILSDVSTIIHSFKIGGVDELIILYMNKSSRINSLCVNENKLYCDKKTQQFIMRLVIEIKLKN